MDSVNNQNPWSPNPVYKDCSQGICSIYCPHWCYIIYPPPPPSIILGDDPDDDPSGFEFSPLIVAVIGILASTFILVTYYTIISRFCRHRGRSNDPSSQTDHEDGDPMNNELAQVSSSSGLDEALIKSIKVCKYKKSGGLVEGSDCSVCLSEFQENESLRLLPKCNHAFHLPCIDTWLKSHSSCPLCRSNISSTITSFPNQRDTPLPDPPASINISALEYQHRNNDVVIMIQSSEPSSQQEILVGFGTDVVPKSPFEAAADDGENMEQIYGHHQLNSCLSQRRVSIADILNDSEGDVEFQREVYDDIGSSRGTEGEQSEENGKNGVGNMVKSTMGMNRSASTGEIWVHKV